MSKIPFTKMHATGNDFVVIDQRKIKTPKIDPKWVELLCHRHFGIGADQLLVLKPSKKADFKMEVWNKDGSRSKMCGNGLRAVACFSGQSKVSIESGAGIHLAQKTGPLLWKVSMGQPQWHGKDIIGYNEDDFEYCKVSVGNNHAVSFVKEDFSDDSYSLGNVFELSEIFGKSGCNSEFVKVRKNNTLDVMVWELGSGPTLACGSGATAVAFAAMHEGLVKGECTVRMIGGTLKITERDGEFFKEGHAQSVFEGVWDY